MTPRTLACGGAVTLFLPLIAAAAPTFSLPLFLPGDAAMAPAVGPQVRPDIARGADAHLVVWSDYRASPDDAPPFASEGTGADVYGARLDASGHLLGDPIMITMAFGDQIDARVAWNGDAWLVVWETPTPTLPTFVRLQAARVTAAGVVLDDPPIEVHEAESYSGFEVAGGDGEWMILTRSSGMTDGLHAVRVLGDGAVANPLGTLIHETLFLLDFDLAFAQGQYLFIWSSSFDGKNARRYAPDLTPIDPAPFTLPGAEFVATDGEDFLVAWHWNSSTKGFVSACRVGADGTVLDPAGIVVADFVAFIEELSMTFDGANYWLAWPRPGGMFKFARVTPAGTVLDLDGFDVPHGQSTPARMAIAGAVGGGIQAVWNDGNNSAAARKDVYTAAVSPGGAMATPEPLSNGAPAQLAADLAEGPGSHLVVFNSRVSGIARIMAQRLGGDGAALDAEPIELASGPALGAPAAAWNGSLYLVVWSDGANVVGRRMLTDGTIVDSEPLAIMPGKSPDVAAAGPVFLVAAVDLLLDNPHWQATFTMRVDGATGELLDAEPLAVGGFVIFAQHPRVVSWGDRWLLTWQTNISHDEPNASVRGAFVDADGTSPGVFFVSFGGWRPDVAVSGEQALFVWSDGSVASADSNIRGRLMQPDGTFPAAEFIVAAAPDRQLYPVATWTGGEFLVAWQDKRNSVIYFDERTDIFGARIAPDGTNLDPSGIAIAATALPEVDPALLFAGGTTLLAASTFRAETEFCAYRIGIQVDDGNAVVGDIDGDGMVGFSDILAVLAAWGPCAGCPADLDGDGMVGITDLLIVLVAWSG